MANILESKEKIKQLLLTNKAKFSKEVFDYLNSLIELEFAVTKDYISKQDREELSKNNIYYQIALYNIYHIIDEILSKLDTIKFVSYEDYPTYSAYEMQGIYKSLSETNSTLFRLIRILYDTNNQENISIINDYYLSCDGVTSHEKDLDFQQKNVISSKLHQKLLEAFDLTSIPFCSYQPEYTKDSENQKLNIITKDTKLVRTLPKITFTHELHQGYYTKK